MIKPKLYVLRDGYPRALSAGRGAGGGSALAVSVGLLGVASPAELEGVVAHEIAHLRHRDVLVQTLAVIVAAALVDVSRVGGFLQRALLFVLAPIAAAFVHLLLSPGREYDADRLAAELCESPHGLADALVRLDQATELVAFAAAPVTEPLYTTNPFADERPASLFASHPPVGERVRRLRVARSRLARAASGRLKAPPAGPCATGPLRGPVCGRNGRRPTLPGACAPSTIGASGLNFSVRNGKRCFPAAMTAQIVEASARRAPSKLHSHVGVFEIKTSSN